MNLFFLDSDLVANARAYSDPHVVKMILEFTQMLYTVLFVLDPERYADLQRHWEIRAEVAADEGGKAPKAYRPTHQHHPMVRFAGSGPEAYRFVLDAGLRLGEEFMRRFRKDCAHACVQHLAVLRAFEPRQWEWPVAEKPQKRRKVETKPVVLGAFAWRHWSGEDRSFEVPLCMPAEYHRPRAVEAYRAYYQSPEKAAKNRWRHSEPPAWYQPPKQLSVV